jgi:hypothetical protein
MDYVKIYNALMASRSALSRSGYLEKHHIIPRSLGGDDDCKNIIKLTAKEHYFAHLLLAKIRGGPMYAALRFMSEPDSKSAKGFIVSARTYDRARRLFAEYCKVSRLGEHNPNFGKKWSESAREKASKRMSGAYGGDKNPMFGRNLTDEHKSKISQGVSGKRKGVSFSDKHRENISKSLTEYHLNNEHWAVGYKHKKETINKMKLSAQDKTVYNFIHPVFGEFTGTRTEFKENYECNQTCLSRLVNGKAKYHKGWRLI